MGFKRISAYLIIRVILITATAVAFAFNMALRHDKMLFYILLFAILLQAYLLYRLVLKTWEHLSIFFEGIENDDFSSMVKARYKDIEYRRLVMRMEKVMQKLKQLHTFNEKQTQFLNAIVENINIGILVIDDKENVEIFNRHAKKMLGIGKVKNFSEFKDLLPEFYFNATNLQPGRTKILKIKFGDEILPVSLMLGEYRFLEKKNRILTFQNIKSELEEKELESWQNLIRVLTHEIMNSIGPMTSTIDTLTEIISENQSNGQTTLDNERTDDIEKGIRIIKERSISIHDFIKRFRSITILPKLNCTQIRIEALFEHIATHLGESLGKEHIVMEKEIFPSNLVVDADKVLIEQVLINLVQNSIDAMACMTDKKITLKAYKSLDGLNIIEVTDNGPGIEEILLDKIFIPFFTTKENGSGIGLSLARQIMRLHNGKITVQSKLGVGTSFKLIF